MDSSRAPQFLPDLVFNKIFSNLELRDLLNCMLVCQNWCRAINNDNAEPWKLMCRRVLPKEVMNSELLSKLPNHKAKLRALYHSWNPKDCSLHFVLKHCGFVCQRYPVAECTDLVRTKIGYQTGKHVWEITWTGPLGSVAMVGVSTKETPVYRGGYIPLLGSTKLSWGWNLSDNILIHNSKTLGKYPLLSDAPKYEVGEKLHLVLDCENGTLHFEKCNQFLGIAFTNLPKIKLFPSVSVVYGDTEVSAVYIGNSI